MSPWRSIVSRLYVTIEPASALASVVKSVLSTPRPLILASASPRRRELLASTAMPFQVVPAAVDERPEPNEAAEVYVRRLALAKAQAVARRYPDAVIVGADTIVTIDGLLL